MVENSTEEMAKEKQLEPSNSEDRVFRKHNGYFTVTDALRSCVYNTKTKEISKGEIVRYYKTHIILIKNIMKCEHGDDLSIQFARFYREADSETWEWAGNPYSGVSLSKEEWQQVFDELNRK